VAKGKRREGEWEKESVEWSGLKEMVGGGDGGGDGGGAVKERKLSYR